MFTTTLTLRRAWLSDPTDPSTVIVAGTMRPADWTEAQDGSVRQYAGGRRQGASTPTKLLTKPVTFVGLNLAGVQQIRAWSGRLVLLRTVYGERHYGTYYEISGHNVIRSSIYEDGRSFNVTVTFYETDYDDSV